MKLPLFFCVAIKLRQLSLPCLFLTSLAMILLSCRESGYPEQLVQADSAYVRGDYIMADSLLDSFDTLLTAGNEPAAMYYQLLRLEQKFVGEGISEDDVVISDSLCRYYKECGEIENYVKSLLFRGDIYMSVRNYPSALKCFLETADKDVCLTVKGWSAQCEGDAFCRQRMFHESKSPYSRFYSISSLNRDTLRLAHAAMRMGTVYKSENNPDSALLMYRKVESLAKSFPRIRFFLPVVHWQICNIHIQLGDYSTARKMLPHDSLNIANWAYLYEGEQKWDSAIHYYKMMLTHPSLQARVEALRALAVLEKHIGHEAKALDYSLKASMTEDTIKQVSLSEETISEKGEFAVNKLKQERDRIESRHQSAVIVFSFTVTLLFIIIAVLFYAWRRYMKKGEAIIDSSEKELNEIQQLNEDVKDPLYNSEIYRKIKVYSGQPDFKLSSEDWKLLGTQIDNCYDNFTNRLLSIANLSESDLHICYLIKLGVPSAHIALLLFKGKSTITMARKRLYKKITQKDGTPTDLNAFLSTF